MKTTILALPAGSLRLADLGYFKVKVFEQLNRQRLRWQIELLFKLWKSDLSLDE